MPQKQDGASGKYILGFDGGGTKTECVLGDSEGNILAKATSGPSNPLRAGYMRAWFALGEAGDNVMARHKLTAHQIAAVCAGLGGAGRPGVARRVTTYFERSYPQAEVQVTTDLDIALHAAFGDREGILLLAGTGSAAFGRDAHGRTARAGGRGPWISDEGGAFDIGRRAVQAVSLADEGRGPETALTKKVLSQNAWRDWTRLLEAISKNSDDVFPKIFPFVAQVADKGDAVAQRILTEAAGELAGLAHVVARELGWLDAPFAIAKAGGTYGRSKFFDAAIESAVTNLMPKARLVGMEMSAAEAAVHMALRQVRSKGNAA
jgi:glucosamine kinase